MPRKAKPKGKSRPTTVKPSKRAKRKRKPKADKAASAKPNGEQKPKKKKKRRGKRDAEGNKTLRLELLDVRDMKLSDLKALLRTYAIPEDPEDGSSARIVPLDKERIVSIAVDDKKQSIVELIVPSTDRVRLVVKTGRRGPKYNAYRRLALGEVVLRDGAFAERQPPKKKGEDERPPKRWVLELRYKPATSRMAKFEIARPLNITWDELGTILRTQRHVLQDLLRAGMDARIACDVVGAKQVKQNLGCKTKSNEASMIAYDAIAMKLDEIRSRDGWSDEQRAALNLPGGMISSLERTVNQGFKLRANYGHRQPVPVRRQELSFHEQKLDGRKKVVARVKLLGGRHHVDLVLRAGKGGDWDRLKKIARGEIRHGSCEIKEDPRGRARKKAKWYVSVSYEPPVREPAKEIDFDKAVIVHRGITNALTLMGTSGLYSYIKGYKIMKQLAQLYERERNHRRIGPSELGSGAKGHGKRRRYENYNALQNKRSRVIDYFCKNSAAEVSRFARTKGENAGVIVIENYGGIEPSEDDWTRRHLQRFPFYKLKQAILDRMELEGRKVIEVPAEYISTTCPVCGNADDRQNNGRTFTCKNEKCSYQRPVDFVAAIHMLKRAPVDSSVWDEKLEKTLRKKLVEGNNGDETKRGNDDEEKA